MQNINKIAMGIDISDHSIEVVELDDAGGKPNIRARGRVMLEPGVVAQGRVANKTKLKSALKEVLGGLKSDDLRSNRVVFALPEAIIFIHVFFLDLNKSKSIEEEVLSELGITIPLRKEDILYTFKILNNNNPIKEKTGIIITAVDKRAYRDWNKFFASAGVKIDIFDIETMALFRGVFNKFPEEPVCLVDVGAVTTKVSIFASVGLVYSYIIKSAGRNITFELARELGISFEAAESLKIDNGLDFTGENTKAVEAAGKIIKKIFSGVKDNINYFNNKYWYGSVKEIVVVGGSSKLRGFEKYLKTIESDLDVRLGKFLFDNEIEREYIGAMGLGMRGLYDYWAAADLFIPGSNSVNGTNTIKDYFNYLRKLKHLVNYKKFSYIMVVFIILLFSVFVLISNNANEYSTVLPEQNTQNTQALPDPIKEIPKESVINTEEILNIEKIKIKKIDSALNVRGGPGTSYEAVSRVNSGEEYELLEETEDWIKIKILDIGDGWVYSNFVERIDSEIDSAVVE